MLIKSIKVSGHKLIGNSVEITLNSKYNVIECDEIALKVISNALASFFHPETALKQHIWAKGEFESNGFIEVKVKNHPKKLAGFLDATSLTLIRKINQRKIIVIKEDENTEHHFQIQKFLNCLCASGISIPTVFTSNVENIVSWINGSLIKDYTSANFADLWLRVYNGVLCNERYEHLQDWILNTRQNFVLDERLTKQELQKTLEKIQDSQEIVKKSENYANIYKRMKTLKGIIETNDRQKYSEEKEMLEKQKIEVQKDIWKMEKEMKSKRLIEDKNDQLRQSLLCLEQLSLTFDNFYFGTVQKSANDLNYQKFIKKFVRKVGSYINMVNYYQKTCEKCIAAENNILHYQFLRENEESKITAINLSEEAKDDFEKSFETLLAAIASHLEALTENARQSTEQLKTFLQDDDPKTIFDDLQDALKLIKCKKADMKTVVDDIKACLDNILVLNGEKQMFEENLQEAKSFIITFTNIPFSHIEGLLHFEDLLCQLREQQSPLYDKFVYLPVREFAWKDFSDNPFTLEGIKAFLTIVVKNAEAANEFMSLLPASTNLKFVCLEEFKTRVKDDLPIIRRARHQDVISMDNVIQTSSVKSLIKDLYQDVVLVSNSSEINDAKLFKRTLYKDDNTFDNHKGLCGGGHVSITTTEVQKNIIKYLNSAKELYFVQENIRTNDEHIQKLQEMLSDAIHNTTIPLEVNMNSFQNYLDLLEFDLKCLQQRNIQQMKVDSINELLIWLKGTPLLDTLEDAYTRKAELKERIANLELEYTNLLRERNEVNRKLATIVNHLKEFGDELTFKYDFGHQQLVDIDKSFNEQIGNDITSLESHVVQNQAHVKNDIDKVGQLHEAQNIELDEDSANFLAKRRELQQFLTRISDISSILKEISTLDVPTNRFKAQILKEFPTPEAQIAELTALQEEILQNYSEYLSPSQSKTLSLKTDVYKYEKYLSSISHWPTGFLESIFIMQVKATSHAISAIMAHARTFCSIILPENVSLQLWLKTNNQNVEEISDFSSVREMCYAIVDHVDQNKYHLPKEMIMLLVILSICATFQAPFIILDDILKVFDKQCWPKISAVLKTLSEKQQIILIHKADGGESFANVDKSIAVRARTAYLFQESTVDDDVDERELYKSLFTSMQSFSLN